jgi:hypothetical protein
MAASYPLALLLMATTGQSWVGVALAVCDYSKQRTQRLQTGSATGPDGFVTSSSTSMNPNMFRERKRLLLAAGSSTAMRCSALV